MKGRLTDGLERDTGNVRGDGNALYLEWEITRAFSKTQLPEHLKSGRYIKRKVKVNTQQFLAFF